MSTTYFTQKTTNNGMELPYRTMTVQALQNAIAQNCMAASGMGSDKIKQMMLRIDFINNRFTSLARTR